MLDEFESEKILFHSLAKQFAKNHPEQAKNLGFDGRAFSNPEIEKLLESVCFINARLKQHITDTNNELYQNILSLHDNNFLKPYPAYSIFKLEYEDYSFNLPFNILTNETIYSNLNHNNRKVACNFLSAFDLEVLPEEDKTKIRLNFSFLYNVESHSINFNNILLFANGPNLLMVKLLFNLFNNVDKVNLVVLDADDNILLNTDNLRLLPYDEFSIQYKEDNNLLDYFLFKERFNFINVAFNTKIDFTDSTKFYIEISCNSIVPSDWFENISFHVNAFPAINLWNYSSEPLVIDNSCYEYPLIIDSTNNDFEIYSIDEVNVITENGVQQASNINDVISANNFEYQYSVLDRFFDSKNSVKYLKINDFSDLDVKKYISCKLKIFNKLNLHELIKPNSYNYSLTNIPEGIKITNLISPENCIKPCNKKSINKLKMELSYDFFNIVDIEKFKIFLRLHNWKNCGLIGSVINSIIDIRIDNGSIVKKGVFHTVLNYNIVFSSSIKNKLEEVYFFSYAIHKFLLTKVPIALSLKTKIFFSSLLSKEKFSFSSMLE